MHSQHLLTADFLLTDSPLQGEAVLEAVPTIYHIPGCCPFETSVLCLAFFFQGKCYEGPRAVGQRGKQLRPVRPCGRSNHKHGAVPHHETANGTYLIRHLPNGAGTKPSGCSKAFAPKGSKAIGKKGPAAKCKGCSGELINKPVPCSCREVTGTHYKTPPGHTVKRSQPLAGIFKNSSLKWFCKQHLPAELMYSQLTPQEKTH